MSHRNTEIVTFSVLPDEARMIKETARKAKKSLSDFLREAARQTIAAYQWKDWCRKGERSARKLGVSPEEIEDLVDELRT